MADRRDVRVAYDRAADVLYVSFGPDVPAIAREVEEGVLARINPETNELVGFTITGFSTRTAQAPVEVGRVQGHLVMEPQLAGAW